MLEAGLVGITDFDCSVSWELSSMWRAKQAFDAARIRYEQRGRAWLRIALTDHAQLYFAPNTGSIRFSHGRIFSSRGLPLAIKIIEAYR